MVYTAKHYMRVAGQLLMPGDVFEAEFTKEQIDRYTRLGAIEEAQSAEAEANAEPEPVSAQQQDEPEETREDEEIVMPAPEIDPMDSIVTEPAPREQKLRRKVKT